MRGEKTGIVPTLCVETPEYRSSGTKLWSVKRDVNNYCCHVEPEHDKQVNATSLYQSVQADPYSF